MAFISYILKDLLREELNYDGVICSDWGLITDKRVMGILFKPASAHGVENLDTDERIKKIIDAGVNLIGGESLTIELARLIKDGLISEEIIDESLRKIMKQKFQFYLFGVHLFFLKVFQVFHVTCLRYWSSLQNQSQKTGESISSPVLRETFFLPYLRRIFQAADVTCQVSSLSQQSFAVQERMEIVAVQPKL